MCTVQPDSASPHAPPSSPRRLAAPNAAAHPKTRGHARCTRLANPGRGDSRPHPSNRSNLLVPHAPFPAPARDGRQNPCRGRSLPAPRCHESGLRPTSAASLALWNRGPGPRLLRDSHSIAPLAVAAAAGRHSPGPDSRGARTLALRHTRSRDRGWSRWGRTHTRPRARRPLAANPSLPAAAGLRDLAGHPARDAAPPRQHASTRAACPQRPAGSWCPHRPQLPPSRHGQQQKCRRLQQRRPRRRLQRALRRDSRPTSWGSESGTTFRPPPRVGAWQGRMPVQHPLPPAPHQTPGPAVSGHDRPPCCPATPAAHAPPSPPARPRSGRNPQAPHPRPLPAGAERRRRLRWEHRPNCLLLAGCPGR